jgi:hypothetical protein
MIRRTGIIGLIAATACGVAGCNQSSPPAVAVAPAEAAEVQSTPATKVPPAAAEPKVDRIADGGRFTFPDDAGGKALAKLVTPPTPAPMPASVPVVQKERHLPIFLDAPAPATFDAASSPPRLPLPDAKPARPTPLPDRVPPDIGGLFTQLPARGEFATGPLTRTEARTVNVPPKLAPLAQRPVADRAPLTDPTIDFTARSVINPNLPLRTEPTGFLRINLPDPFENVEAAKPRTPVVENPNRSLGHPPPMK